LKCDEAQGYLFGKPMPPEIFESAMAPNPPRKSHVLSDAGRPPADSLPAAVNE